MIGTTRRVNEAAKTIEWTRPAGNQAQHQRVVFSTLPEKEDQKMVFQIGTSDPELAVKAARLVAADVSGIDVNAGCPKPFSTIGGMGAALLREPEKLCSILEALVKHIMPEFEIGISVKIRILETPAQTEALVRKLVATGITGLTVHCRTTPMRPRERAIRGQLRMIADICREAGVACLMNGDVETKEQGVKLAEEFGADGAMIGISAEKNLSCFRTAEQGGMLPWATVSRDFVEVALNTHNAWSNTKYMLAQIIPGKEQVYKQVPQTRTYSRLCDVLGYEDLMDQAAHVDSLLGLEEKPTKGAPAKQQAQPEANSKKRKQEDQDAAGDEQAKRPKGLEVPQPAAPAPEQAVPPLQEPVASTSATATLTA
jgi:tRNA-dihydrouridine synthase 2